MSSSSRNDWSPNKIPLEIELSNNHVKTLEEVYIQKLILRKEQK